MSNMDVEPVAHQAIQCIYCTAPATEKCLVCGEFSTCARHALEYDQNHNTHPM